MLTEDFLSGQFEFWREKQTTTVTDQLQILCFVHKIWNYYLICINYDQSENVQSQLDIVIVDLGYVELCL